MKKKMMNNPQDWLLLMTRCITSATQRRVAAAVATYPYRAKQLAGDRQPLSQHYKTPMLAAATNTVKPFILPIMCQATDSLLDYSPFY